MVLALACTYAKMIACFGVCRYIVDPLSITAEDQWLSALRKWTVIGDHIDRVDLFRWCGSDDNHQLLHLLPLPRGTCYSLRLLLLFVDRQIEMHSLQSKPYICVPRIRAQSLYSNYATPVWPVPWYFRERSLLGITVDSFSST